MIKCVKIICMLAIEKDMAENLQKLARKLHLEGSLQIISKDEIKIIACGLKENIDSLVDTIYKEGTHKKNFSIEVEPFLKDKDYRGVFRIIA